MKPLPGDVEELDELAELPVPPAAEPKPPVEPDRLPGPLPPELLLEAPTVPF